VKKVLEKDLETELNIPNYPHSFNFSAFARRRANRPILIQLINNNLQQITRGV